MGGPGHIPFLAIDRFAERYGVSDPDEFREFHEVIRSMDTAFLADWRRRHPPRKQER